jgi:hypothetical protein
MSRPLYETLEDTGREWMDVLQWCGELNEEVGSESFSLRKIPLSPAGQHTADYEVLNTSGVAVAVVEYKQRGYTLEQTTKLGGFMLSTHKYNMLIQKLEYGIKPALLVRFTDGLRWLPLSQPHTVAQGVGGRTDRNDPLDTEPVHYFTNPSEWRKTNG